MGDFPKSKRGAKPRGGNQGGWDGRAALNCGRFEISIAISGKSAIFPPDRRSGLNLNHYLAISGPPRRRRGGRRRRRFEDRGSKKNTVEGEDKAVEIDGTISAVLAGTMFKVKLNSGHELLAHISGKMRKRFIRLVVGDKVKMEMSPYDTSKARIVYRLG